MIFRSATECIRTARGQAALAVPLPVATTLVAAAVLVVATTPLASQAGREAHCLTLERIFESGEFRRDRHDGGRWLPDGNGWLRIEERDGGIALVRYDAASGAVVDEPLPPESLIPPGAGEPLRIQSWERSDDGSTWLLQTVGGGWWTLSVGQAGEAAEEERTADQAGGEVVRPGAGRLRNVGGAAAATLSGPALSPRGDRVAWVAGGDLWVEDLASNRVVRLTLDGSPSVVNGTTEGVYAGMNRGGFRWSPDGERIAFVQFDMEGVREFSIVNYTDSLYATVQSVSYVKPGGTLPAARLGVVDADGGEVSWLELPGDPRNRYITGFEWVPGSGDLFVQHLGRPPQDVRLYAIDLVSGGALREVLAEQENTWLDLQPVRWVEGGRAFLWVSERDGWRHVYRVSLSGGEPELLTPGDFDIMSVAGVDEASGWVYVIASPEDPGRRYLYRASLDGRGAVERVTPRGQEGTHEYDVAPGARFAWHTFSTIDTPPVTELISLPDHRTIGVEVDNAALASRLRALELPPTEFFTVGIGDGVELHGWVLKPPDFDPDLLYPVLLYVYGMPAAQTVLDAWSGDRHLFHHHLAQRGYVVMSLDNRGTPAPKGKAWRRSIHLVHGVLPAREQAAAVRALEARWPWMDPARTGIYGWSGGGNVSVNAILRHPDVFQLAMPGAGISDHRYYHAGFTERFLGLPQDNPEAYEATAPARVAGNLEGHLLIIHGTGDPNVHYQNAELLVNALIEAKKRFMIMPYPNRPHGVPDRLHLHDLYLWFLETHMPPGPGSGPAGVKQENDS